MTKDKREVNKEAIAKLLFKPGASYKTNSIGLTPICYAGLHQMKQLVNLFLESESTGESVGDEDKIRGLEYLGVAYATLWRYDHTSMAYQCILEAKQLRLACSYPLPMGENSEVEKLFQRSECGRVEDLEAIKEDSEAIQIEGFLIGARIIPDELKPQYYWEALLDFARRNFSKAPTIITFFFQSENAIKMPLDHVLEALQYAAAHRNTGLHVLSELNEVLTLLFNEVSTMYSDKLKEGTICTRANEIIGVLVGMLSDAAVYSYGEKYQIIHENGDMFLEIC